MVPWVCPWQDTTVEALLSKKSVLCAENLPNVVETTQSIVWHTNGTVIAPSVCQSADNVSQLNYCKTLCKVKGTHQGRTLLGLFQRQHRPFSCWSRISSTQRRRHMWRPTFPSSSPPSPRWRDPSGPPSAPADVPEWNPNMVGHANSLTAWWKPSDESEHIGF